MSADCSHIFIFRYCNTIPTILNWILRSRPQSKTQKVLFPFICEFVKRKSDAQNRSKAYWFKSCGTNQKHTIHRNYKIAKKETEIFTI